MTQDPAVTKGIEYLNPKYHSYKSVINALEVVARAKDEEHALILKHGLEVVTKKKDEEILRIRERLYQLNAYISLHYIGIKDETDVMKINVWLGNLISQIDTELEAKKDEI